MSNTTRPFVLEDSRTGRRLVFGPGSPQECVGFRWRRDHHVPCPARPVAIVARHDPLPDAHVCRYHLDAHRYCFPSATVTWLATLQRNGEP